MFGTMREKRAREINFPFVLIIILQVVSCVGTFQANQLSRRVVFPKKPGPVQGILGPGNVRVQYHAVGNRLVFKNYGENPVVETFKGIPYASPPLGPLRFSSPDSPQVTSRTEVFTANLTKHSCPKTLEDTLNRTSVPSNPLRALKKTMVLDDCLYLDIYAPLHDEKFTSSGKLAVLVYINSHSDRGKQRFDGSSMAAIGNVITVTFRYRAGVLGFLQPGFSEDLRTNFGLWDQIAALQWIRENIEEFGGDPEKVTIMAYDMDATIAGLLPLSQLSQAYNGLFHRVILLNGSPLSPYSINPRPLEVTFQLARALRCPLHDRGGNMLRCFQKKPIPQLISAAESIGTNMFSYPFAPTVDKILVSDRIDVYKPESRKKIKEMFGNFDLLCGLREGPVLPEMAMAPIANMDFDQFIVAVIKTTLNLDPGSQPTELIINEVKNALVGEYGPSPPMRELLSDYLMVYPIISLLDLHSETRKNTFFYVSMDYDPLNHNTGSELSYLFGDDVYNWKYRGIPSPKHDLHPYFLLINLIANFVRQGDPNIMETYDKFPSPMKSWPKYKKDRGRYLKIGKQVSLPSGYRKSQMEFWNKEFPRIISSFAHTLNSTDNHNFGSFPPFNSVKNNQLESESKNVFGATSNHPYGHGTFIRQNSGFSLHDTFGDEGQMSWVSPIIVIGCLLLFLNILCFLGLYYQRKRLKRTELQLRRRYIEPHSNTDPHSVEFEDVGSIAYGAIPTEPERQSNRIPPSETETENGFGPDFFGPNYDPRTKVNRWMSAQQNSQVGKQQAPMGECCEPPQSQDRYLSSPKPPLAKISSFESEDCSGLTPDIMHFKRPGFFDSCSSQATTTGYPTKVGSFGRKAPRAVLDPPVQYCPPPTFNGIAHNPPSAMGGSDIPYVDSRNTSPSIISAPAMFSNMGQNFITPPPALIESSEERKINGHFDSTSSASDHQMAGPGSSTSSARSFGKRSSVVIVKDLDPVEEQAPKYVPVKTGTLTRSVGVHTDGHIYSALPSPHDEGNKSDDDKFHEIFIVSPPPPEKKYSGLRIYGSVEESLPVDGHMENEDLKNVSAVDTCGVDPGANQFNETKSTETIHLPNDVGSSLTVD